MKAGPDALRKRSLLDLIPNPTIKSIPPDVVNFISLVGGLVANQYSPDKESHSRTAVFVSFLFHIFLLLSYAPTIKDVALSNHASLPDVVAVLNVVGTTFVSLFEAYNLVSRRKTGSQEIKRRLRQRALRACG